jgi:hypothetical protein
MRTHLIRIALPAALLLAAAPARAQVGNGTDAGFPPFGGAASGSYLGPGLRTENEMFARAGDDVVFRNARTGCALRLAERTYRDSVASAPRTPSQARVQTLLGLIPGTPDVAAVAAALAHGAPAGSPLERAATTLANALNGLMRDRGACPDTREGYDEAPQWQDAIRAFNDYMRVVPDAALSPPPPELIAIHEALQTVIYGTLRPPRA